MHFITASLNPDDNQEAGLYSHFQLYSDRHNTCTRILFAHTCLVEYILPFYVMLINSLSAG